MSVRSMSDDNDIAIWDRFWESQNGGQSGGCLPDGWRAIEITQNSVWRDFLAGASPNCAVLDLATGDGRVLKWIEETGRAGELVGVDSAHSLPECGDAIRMLTGIPIENLPFEADRFDLVTSQFGFEYSRVEDTAAQIAKVMRDDGRAGLMMHCGDGPILAHNLARAAAIKWVAEDRKLFERAMQAVRAGPQFFHGFVTHCQGTARMGAERFGPQSPAWEIAEAIARSFQMEQRHRSGNLRQTLDAIRSQSRNELERISSLQRACAVADDDNRLAKAFERAGLTQVSLEPVQDAAGAAFATVRVLRKR